MRNILFLLLFFICESVSAQKMAVVTSCPDCVRDSTSAKISGIMIVADTVYMAKVEILSLEYKESFIPKINQNSKLVAGNDTLSVMNVVALQHGSSYPSEYNINGVSYWKDFKKNNAYYCIAICCGKLSKELDHISLINNDKDCYQFDNVKVSLTASPYNNLFQLLRKTGCKDSPKVEVFNNSDVVMTISYDKKKYNIEPRKKELISLNTKAKRYEISLPGIPTMVGTQKFRKGEEYFWEYKAIDHEF